MADLIIRYRALDPSAWSPPATVRPIPNNCGGADSPPPWLSDSIWLSDPSGLNTLTKAKVGQACMINVRIASLGQTFTQDPGTKPLRAQVWVSNAWLGVGPDGVPAGSVFIGANPPQPVFANGLVSPPSPDIARFDWTPVSADLDPNTIDPNTNEAHMCIAANVFWTGVAPAPPPPPPAEGAQVMGGVLSICGNQRHGQRNIDILPAGPGITGLHISMSNPGDEEGVFQLVVEERRGRLGRAEREALLALPFVGLAGREQLTRRDLKRWLAKDGLPIVPLERIALRGKGKPALGPKRVPLVKTRAKLERLDLEFEGERGRKLKVKLPPAGSVKEAPHVDLAIGLADKASPGELAVADVMLLDRKGRLVGATRVVALRATERDLKFKAPPLLKKK